MEPTSEEIANIKRVVDAGVPRKPGMTRDDSSNINAGIVRTCSQGSPQACPKACALTIPNPVNSTVPIAAKALKQKGVYGPRKPFGITTLDMCRARTFVAEAKGLDPTKTKVPVIGGPAGTTIVPFVVSDTSGGVWLLGRRSRHLHSPYLGRR
jgi:malate/lactate dehydrogenase